VVLDVALGAIRARVHLLEIDRERDVRDAAVGERRATRQVGDVLDVGRSHDSLVELRDVGVQPIQRHVLLGERADEVVKRHARNGEDRLPVECGVVEAVQEMDPARGPTSRGRHPAGP